jgi:hypothetical protein
MLSSHLIRSRWAAIGAAVAVSLGAGGIIGAQAATSPSPSIFTATVPKRILDTRTGVGAPAAKISASGEIALTVTGGDTGVPEDATAVVLNLTATGGTANSYLTVYPQGTPRPDASVVNVQAGIDTPNMITAKIGDNGQIRIFNATGSVHVLADVAGYYQASADRTAVRFGQFDSAGTLHAGNIGINMPRQSVGFYRTTGSGDWQTCTFTVSVNSDNASTARYAIVTRGAFPTWTYVYIYTAAGALVDAAFSLVETCPES